MTTEPGGYDMGLEARAARREGAGITGPTPVPERPDLLDEVLAVFEPLGLKYRPASNDPAFGLVRAPTTPPLPNTAVPEATAPSRAPVVTQSALFPTLGAPGMTGTQGSTTTAHEGGGRTP